VKKLVHKSPAERDRLLLEYPLEQQVDLYLKLMDAIHPPDMGLAAALASHGAAIVPFLELGSLRKMKTSKKWS